MFGKNLKKIRSVHGMSQQQFAEIFDLKRATLGAYEEGRSNPKMDTVIKIANHFSLDIQELLTSELTVNRLLKFNEHITLRPESGKVPVFPTIPCLSEKEKQDFLKALKRKTTIDLPQISLPFVEGTGKLAFIVEDASMSGNTPSFLPKDTIVGERLELENIGSASGKLALVATDKEILFRKMTLSGEAVLLQASQTGVGTVEIPVSAVLGVWVVVHAFHFTLPMQSDVEARLSALENLIGKIQQ